jgi:[acyl-carrier-protein] S-malonyltransferase
MPLSTLIFSGRSREIEPTEILQPAISVVNAACLAVLRELGYEPAAAAGHSLGEYSAVFAAGAVDFDGFMRLVQTRGRLMGEAAEQQPGGLLAVSGMSEEEVQAVVQEASGVGIVCIANLNTPEQIVLSGENDALQRAGELAMATGARRIVRLPVSGAWHSPLMLAAQESFEKELAAASFRDAAIDVYCNVTAEPVRAADRIRYFLGRQVCSPVRWADSVTRILADHPEAILVEVGPGRVLMGLSLRIDARRRVLNVESVKTLESFLKKVG